MKKSKPRKWLTDWVKEAYNKNTINGDYGDLILIDLPTIFKNTVGWTKMHFFGKCRHLPKSGQ